MSFLTPQLFDALVYLTIAVGLVLAGMRIYRDMKSGPRWPEVPITGSSEAANDQSQTETQR
jgi:hypothetical protein